MTQNKKTNRQWILAERPVVGIGLTEKIVEHLARS